MHLDDLGLEIFWFISFGNVFITLAVKRQQPDWVCIDETQITRNIHDSVVSGRRKNVSFIPNTIKHKYF